MKSNDDRVNVLDPIGKQTKERKNKRHMRQSEHNNTNTYLNAGYNADLEMPEKEKLGKASGSTSSHETVCVFLATSDFKWFIHDEDIRIVIFGLEEPNIIVKPTLTDMACV